MIEISGIKPRMVTQFAYKLTLILLCFFVAACSTGTGVINSSHPNVNMAAKVAGSYHTDSLKAVADRLATSGNHSAAIPLYRHMTNQDLTGKAHLALAESLLALGNSNEAADILIKLIGRFEPPIGTWRLLGKTWLAQGQVQQALTAYDQALQRAPNDTAIKSGRAVALASLGRSKEALQSLEGSTEPSVLSNKALILAVTGHEKQAIIILESLIKQGNASHAERQNLVLAYLIAERNTDAYNMARLDFGPENTADTLTFYRGLMQLPIAQRMQALVIGAIDPAWSMDEKANLIVQNSLDKEAAAKRLIAPKPKLDVKPQETSQKISKVQPIRKPNADLSVMPPLLEKTGWALQIAAYRTENNLIRGMQILYRENDELLKNVPPRRSEIDFGDVGTGPKGFYYRLNAGPLKSLKRAKELCNALLDRGTKCWIRPPENSEGTLPK